MSPVRAKYFLLIPALIFNAAAHAADYYAAPNGNGNGSISSPWSLGTALNAAVRPGDTIWLRGGTYSGAFTSYLTGAAGAPIVVRQYPGERAILDVASDPFGPALTIYGSNTWYWGFEVTNSDGQRIYQSSSTSGRAFGLNIFGPNTKVINLVVHDTGEGLSFWTPATDSELYGNVVYYNGWDGTDRGHGHGVYVQNQTGAKNMADNIVFDQFGWGFHAYAEGGYIDNLTFDGNFSFNNGAPSFKGYTNNFLVQATNVAQNPVLQNNASYYTPSAGAGLNIVANCSNANINNNYFVSGYFAISLPAPCVPTTMAGNTFWGIVPGWVPGAYPNNTYYTSRPSGVKTIVRPNRYEPGRANIAIFNWDRQAFVNVDVSAAGLGIGQSYEIRDSQNYLGGPVATGTYQGTPVAIPMTGTAKASPIGTVNVIPPHTDMEFGVFVLLPSGSGSPPPADNIPPTVSLTAPGNGASVSGAVAVTANASDNVGVVGVQFKLDSSPLGAEANAAPYATSWDTTKTSNGSHTLTATARDAAGNQASSSISVTVNNTAGGPPGSFAPIRVNAGGLSYIDSQGQLWSADYGYSGTGGTYTSANAISGTNDPALYRSERWTYPGPLGYDFAVPGGTYTVNLKFAENFATGPGQRLFDIVVNGQTCAASYDIFAQAGAASRAVDKQCAGIAATSAISIRINPVVGGAKVNALEILQGAGGPPPPGPVSIAVSPGSVTLGASGSQQFTATVTGSSDSSVSWTLNAGAAGTLSAGLYIAPSFIPNTQIVTVTATSNADTTKSASATVTLQPASPPPTAFTPIRVRAGAGPYTDSQGRQWSGDYGYSGVGGVYTTSSAILGTNDIPLYQSERWAYPGALEYDFSAPAGAYTVNLKFAENYANGPGQRIFNIVINGQTCALNFDIFSQAGGMNTAFDQQCAVSSGGSISIQLLPVAGAPKINAIEIF